MDIRKIITVGLTLAVLIAPQGLFAKEVEDFNFNWKFSLEKQVAGHQFELDDSQWQSVRLPHDWAVALPYTEDGAASTGFKMGGIGWYRKTFSIDSNDKDKSIWVEFDGIYNNSEIWLNGHHIGGRPYGYTSFQVDLTPYLHYDDTPNTLAVRVNRTAYADSRWYTGSGIYRNVRLVKADAVYVPQWGMQVTTLSADANTATIKVKTKISAKAHIGEKADVSVAIVNAKGETVSKSKTSVTLNPNNEITQELKIKSPQRWSLESPDLYTAKVSIDVDGDKIEQDHTTFGVRTFKFDSRKGFFLNGKNVKIKGVNLHHDAGAVGVAVPKSVWRSRLERLQSVGVNALRLSHNPHSPELLELADEMGFLVNSEAFDDWDVAKKKSKSYLGDNKATGESAVSYNEHFNVWAERDIKDLIRRDFNHPSVIMWSIGNEIEWTYEQYPKAVSHDEDGTSYYEDSPDFDKARIRSKITKYSPNGVDNLPVVAAMLAKFVKEEDTTRPVTAGLTHPSVGFASGYTDALDIVGFNYRAAAYEEAHKLNPDTVIYGSENWGSWREWRDVKDKPYVSGIFIWTGFAYKGEAGPLPRMGLDISLFDFVGNKTARGHFFETLWVDTPKTYVGTTAASKSEFSYNDDKGWSFTSRSYPKHIWDKIRMWEWYDISEIWKYAAKEPIVVQSYANTESVELFLNGRSLGRQEVESFDDRVVKWLVPYQAGELKVVGYNQGKAVAESIINTHGELADITLTSERNTLIANQYDTTYIHGRLIDAKGNLLVDSTQAVEFSVAGPAEILVVDNGSENNIQDVLSKRVESHKGKSAVLIRSTNKTGKIVVTAKVGKKVISRVEIDAVKK